MAGNVNSAPGQAHWSSRAAFVLAAVGSAVGLGNLWRFPSEAGANGGGAFVLIYVLCVALIGAPLLLAETLIGRHGQRSTIGSAAILAKQSGASSGWAALAVIGLIANFLILTFYSVVAGWVLYYVATSLGDVAGAVASGQPFAGAYAGLTTEQVRAQMPDLFADPGKMLIFHAVFAIITTFIVARGVKSGIEVAAVWLMPAFFLLLIGITAYSAVVGDLAAAAAFLFQPDFQRAIQPQVLNSALGQAFFSLSLGGGAMVAYGAYASRETNLSSSAGTIAFADTAVAIVAGLAIFPIVFSVGLSPDAGPTLMFQTLPAAFHSMPGGALVALAFFVLAFFAAVTSSVSLLEIGVGWVMERFKLGRVLTSSLLGLGFFLIGLVSLFSFNIWADQRPLPFLPGFENATWFDAIDGVTGKLLLPLSGLITAIFIGWVADKKLVDPETGLRPGRFLPLWRALIAWVCPLAVALILLFGLFPQLIS
ncbi:MAG: sodium-dependent transporter [Phenylobacterium sp.]|uniref:sodium-dependent transporter n=1 Tax=Phenylobacterium sp. TaxID=1871053 RepID=UPI00391D7628